MILIYDRLTEKQLKKAASEVVKNLTKWFKDNPKRKMCRAELWYGKMYSIKRKNIKGQINEIVAGLLKEIA